MAARSGDQSGLPWMLILCDAWLTPLAPGEADQIFAGASLHNQIH